MPKPLRTFSIKFTDEQRRFLKRIALAQRHGHIGTAVKRLVDREMRGHATA